MRSRAMVLPFLCLLGIAMGVGCSSEDGELAEPATLPADPEPDGGAQNSDVDASVTSAIDGASSGDGGACPRVRVEVPPGEALNVRQGASTTAAVAGRLPNKAVVDVLARETGELVSGTTDWFKVDATPNDGFISAAFAKCTTAAPPVLEAPSAYRLPLECKKSARITQGNDGPISHRGNSFYAFDFALPLNTPLVAIADGIVTSVFADTGPGDPCYAGGGPSCRLFANHVALKHGDGSASIYKHLNKVLVVVGEFVPSGSPIGLTGSTGYSTGPHAHVMRQENCADAVNCKSIPLKFADVPGSGVPVTGQTVTSANGCPK